MGDEPDSSAENKHFNHALHEMYELTRLGTMKLSLSANEEEWLKSDISSTSSEGHQHKSKHAKKHKQSKTPKREDSKSKSKGQSKSRDDPAVSKVYTELCDINVELQNESQRLREWESELQQFEVGLKEKERQLLYLETQQKDYMELNRREILENVESRISELETRLQKHNETADENKRLRTSVKTFKESNAKLKLQLSQCQMENKQFVDKNSTLQRRIVNLQCRVEHLSQEKSADIKADPKKSNEPKSASDTKQILSHGKSKQKPQRLYEIIAALLGWVSNSYLIINIAASQSSMTIEQNSKEHDVSQHITDECCVTILPAIASVFGECVHYSNSVQLPFLQFAYWTLLVFEDKQSEQRLHPVSFRHISQVVYNPGECKKLELSAEMNGKSKSLTMSQNFLYSTDSHLRLLSTLFLLKTLTQADLLAKVFEILIYELHRDEARGQFLSYQGTRVLLYHTKPSSKGLFGHVNSVLMQLVAESAYLSNFLHSINTAPWIQAFASFLLDNSIDVKQIEKISIVLQRLSKLKKTAFYRSLYCQNKTFRFNKVKPNVLLFRSSKALFETFQMYGIIEQLSRKCNPDNTFLLLNLKSILHNLEAHRN